MVRPTEDEVRAILVSGEDSSEAWAAVDRFTLVYLFRERLQASRQTGDWSWKPARTALAWRLSRIRSEVTSGLDIGELDRTEIELIRDELLGLTDDLLPLWSCGHFFAFVLLIGVGIPASRVQEVLAAFAREEDDPEAVQFWMEQFRSRSDVKRLAGS